MSLRQPAGEKVQLGDLDNATHEGYLLMKTFFLSLTSWKKSWFVLKDKKMFYYPNRKENATPTGVIDIAGYMIELVDDQELVRKLIEKDELALFQLFHPSKPQLLFCAIDEQALQEWFNSILLEFSREYIRQSTYVDFSALDDNDIPDYSAFRARKTSILKSNVPDESDFYQELELEQTNESNSEATEPAEQPAKPLRKTTTKERELPALPIQPKPSLPLPDVPKPTGQDQPKPLKRSQTTGAPTPAPAVVVEEPKPLKRSLTKDGPNASKSEESKPEPKLPPRENSQPKLPPRDNSAEVLSKSPSWETVDSQPKLPPRDTTNDVQPRLPPRDTANDAQPKLPPRDPATPDSQSRTPPWEVADSQPKLPPRDTSNDVQPKLPPRDTTNDAQPKLPPRDTANDAQPKLPPRDTANDAQPKLPSREKNMPPLPERPNLVSQNKTLWEANQSAPQPAANEARKSVVQLEIDRERKRLQEEAEKRNMSDAEAEKKRKEQQEAEKKKLEQEAQKKKEETERKKKEQEEADKKKEQQEAEKKRKEQEDLDRKKKEQQEAEKKKKEQSEAENKKQEETEKKKKEQQEAEKKRKEQEDLDRKKKEQEEADKKKEQEESERKRKEQEEAEKKKKEEEETEKKKKIEVKKSAALLEIEREKERQQEEVSKRSNSPSVPILKTAQNAASANLVNNSPLTPRATPTSATPTPTSTTSATSIPPTPARNTVSMALNPKTVPAESRPVSVAPQKPAVNQEDDKVKPYATNDYNRITVVTKAKPAAIQSSGTPQRLFSGRHSTVKDACVDWINSRLGQDTTLVSKGLVPVNTSNLAAKCKDGILLCKLVNTAVSKTLDDRAINYEGLNDSSRVKENMSLCLNSARSIGCSFVNVQPETLMKGEEDVIVTTISQFIIVYLRNRLKIMYDGDDTNYSCGLCTQRVDNQYAMKGSAPFCMNCINQPLNIINLFSGEGTPVAATSNGVMMPSVDMSKATDYQEVVRQVDDISARLKKLTDQEICDGKGNPLLSDMKALMSKLQAVAKKYPIESYDLVQRYNALTKEIPERINSAYKAGGQKEVVLVAGGAKCAKCQKPLSGQTIEVFGNSYHQECFGCHQCGRALGKSCLNIDNKPYCEHCAKKAFIQSRLKNRQNS